MKAPPAPRPTVWSPAFKLFHWSTAAMILGMFVLGWVAVSYTLSPTKLELFKWHKSAGLLILAWVLLRLAWRATHRGPGLPAVMGRHERWAAHLAHALLYALMIAMPISGWIINSASDFPLKWFGLFRVPQLIGPNKGVQDSAELVHLMLFWTLLVVLVVHVAAALRHHFIRRNDVLRRMLPFTNFGKPER
jgi:cytochrome b561